MKFRIREYTSQRHSKMNTNVSWRNNNEFMSLGDDNVVLRYDLSNESVSQLCEFEEEATVLDCMPHSRGNSESFVCGFSDGSIKILSKFGKVEK